MCDHTIFQHYLFELQCWETEFIADPSLAKFDHFQSIVELYVLVYNAYIF